jgi:hypothetical protein
MPVAMVTGIVVSGPDYESARSSRADHLTSHARERALSRESE